jgi:hypothetical protein
MKRSADLQVRAGDILLWANAQTVDSLWIAFGPIVKIPDTATDDDIASAARAVLDGSIQGIPRSDPLTGFKRVLSVAGVGSERAFNRGARSVGLLEEADGTITLSPMKPEGGGWIGINDKVIAVHNPTATELASAIRRAIVAGIPRA